MISLRPYTPKDDLRLYQVIDKVCTSVPWMSTRCFVPTPAWKHAMRTEHCLHHQLLVAECQGEIVGWSRLFPRSCELEPSQVELGIGLLAQYRNRGIGSQLMKLSLDWAKSTGFFNVILTVSLQNSIAIHVFDKCGFETDQTYDNKMLMTVRLS